MATALNTGLQNKEKAAKSVDALKINGPAPAAVPAGRREIRTVLVAAHGWPTEALVPARRRIKR